MGDDSTSRKIKVVDRRWFTEEGDLREDLADRVARTPKSGDAEAAAEPPAGPAEPEPADPPAEASPPASTSPVFLELVGMLAQQAELLLTGAEGFPKEPTQARRMIDYLAVLESKTRRNLSAEESQILSNLIFQLRTLFVQSGG